MPLTHKLLIKFIRLYLKDSGHRFVEGGICSGFSASYLSALMLSDTSTFEKRLGLLSTYHKKPPRFFDEITRVKEKCKKREAINHDEKAHLEALAFFESVCLQQNPQFYPDLFSGYRSHSYIRKQSIAGPKRLKENPPHILHSACHAFSRKELEAHFKRLQPIHDSHKGPVALSIGTGIHNIVIHWDKRIQKWRLMDINQFDRAQSFEALPLTATQLSHHLFESTLGIAGGEYALLGIEHITTKLDENTSKKIIKLDPNYLDKTLAERTSVSGCSLLYLAANAGHLESVRSLIIAGVNVNQARNDGATPFFIAAQMGHHAVVELLIQNGADINQAMNHGVTPLYLAVQNGDHAVVELLLLNDANVNQARNDGASPLLIAVTNGHPQIVRALLEAGAQDTDTPYGKASERPECTDEMRAIFIEIKEKSAKDALVSQGLFASAKSYAQASEGLAPMTTKPHPFICSIL